MTPRGLTIIALLIAAGWLIVCIAGCTRIVYRPDPNAKPVATYSAWLTNREVDALRIATPDGVVVEVGRSSSTQDGAAALQAVLAGVGDAMRRAMLLP